MTATELPASSTAPLVTRAGPLNALLLTLGLVSGLIGSLGAPLVPSIAIESGVSISTAQWTLTGNLLVGAVATPLVGRIASGHRLRITTLVVVATCGVGCLISALSFGFMGLLVGRLIQGLSLCVVPLAIAVARTSLGHADFVRAAGVVSVSGLLGGGLGYPLSSAIAARSGIDGAFLVGAVLCLGVLVLARVHLPRFPHAAVVRTNWLSGVVLGVGVASGLLSVTWLALDPAAPRVWVAALLCLVLVPIWIRTTWRSANPLVDLRLATRPVVVLGNTVALVAGISGYALFTCATQYVQSPAVDGAGLGLGVESAGWVILPFCVTGFLAPRVVTRLRRMWSEPGILIAACFFGLVSSMIFAVGPPSYLGALIATGVGGFGVGMTFAVIPVMVTRGVPQAESASALSFCQLLRSIGFSLGTTMAAAFFAIHTAAGELLPDYRGYAVASAVGAVLWLLLAFGIALARRNRTWAIGQATAAAR